MTRRILCLVVLLIGLGLVACGFSPNNSTPAAQLPNPASVYCEQHGGKLELRQDASGGVAGICVFADGSECDEWAYFRGECRPGAGRISNNPISSPAASRGDAPSTGELASDGWRIYRDPGLGFSFHYPPDATIGTADDPGKTLMITGPLVGNDHWPVIYISHPTDREDYRPPEGVDLERWLTEHNLLMVDSKQGEVRKPDLGIAGVKAIHTRLLRSPQTFAYDKYYFAKDQQLYTVVILHAGDKEDWELYDHFLTSIQF